MIYNNMYTLMYYDNTLMLYNTLLLFIVIIHAQFLAPPLEAVLE